VPIIVSGGYPARTKKKPRYTEAEVMRHWLVAHGVPRKMILVETRSRDTIGNAYYSKKIVKRHRSWKNILVLTTYAHVVRARWIFQKVFGERYTIKLHGVPSREDRLDKGSRALREKYVTGLYRVALAPVRDGDDKRIMELVKYFHPAEPNKKWGVKGTKGILAN
jgi:uncharacterized SAM-binding protein YcdF (DUF218 family)